MYRHSDVNRRRLAAGIMISVMLFVVLFSSFYIAAESGHICSGEDCPVCSVLHLCEQALHEIGSGVTVQIGTVLPIFIVIVTVSLFLPARIPETLVSEKIRLND